MPVLALTPAASVWRQLALEWGIVPGRLPRGAGIEPLLTAAERAAVDLGCARAGDHVVLVAGRLRTRDATATVRIRVIEPVKSRGRAVRTVRSRIARGS